MKIGFDAKRAFFNNTGLGNYSRDTIRILSKKLPDHNFNLYTPIEKHNKRLDFLKDRENISIKTPNYILDKTFKSYWRSYSIKNDLVRDNINIFHGLSHEIPFGIEKTNIKTIVTIHDLIFLKYPQFFNYFDRKIYYKKIKLACEKANKIIAISKQTKHDIIDLLKIPEEEIDVVYQTCNDLFQKKIDKNVKNNIIQKYKIPKKFILNVSSFNERKNQINLIKSLNHLKNQNLLLVGNGKSYLKKCKKYIKKNNLNKRVYILTEIPMQDLASLYQSAEVMVYPSIYEGFGIPILEALYSKVPVITSKGGCFNETGGKKTIYINPKNEYEIADAVNKVTNNIDLRNEMIDEGYKHSKIFSKENLFNKLLKIYNNI